MASLAGGALGFGYGYLVAQRPLTGLLTPFLAVLFGSLLGLAGSRALAAFRVRNLWVARAVAITVAAVALYVAWAAWITAVVRSLGMQAGLFDFLFHPGRLDDALLAANRAGYWHFLAWRPHGAVLGVLWFLEAAIVFAAAAIMTESQLTQRAYCEGCGAWTRRETAIARVPDADFLQFRRHLEERDFAYLAELGELPADADRWTAFDLHTCPRCGALNLLDAWAVSVRGRKQSESRQPLFAKLILKTEDVRALRALGARQRQAAVRAKAAAAEARSS